MLFRAIGQEEQKINGFALKQITKKPLIAVTKELREESIWRFNKLLNNVKKKALYTKQLSEQELMGIVISVKIGYSILRLTDIHRLSAEKGEGGTWQLHTQIIKVKGNKATLTFRPLADLNMCPTFWLQQWFQRRKRKDKDKPLWFIFQKNRHTIDDEYSKATHLILKQA
ncbi:MAG: hypothetical protein EZS28_031893 [Streblomastix strix]|uniref:Tyr recombinase domain-containing protein n=1 Tax=Streblomastix strix TaxID=222440 RepID=A0A5J4URD5_9EUKA|nr:MAG: hypothetical protein EZS28_031893 [Streblomastix strix]